MCVQVCVVQWCGSVEHGMVPMWFRCGSGVCLCVCSGVGGSWLSFSCAWHGSDVTQYRFSCGSVVGG